MSPQERQAIERRIIERLVTDAIAAGYAVSVDDGGETTVRRSTYLEEIMAAVQTTDEDYVFFHRPDTTDVIGWVRLIYGNDGWDVIADHTDNEAIRTLVAGASALADQIEGENV